MLFSLSVILLLGVVLQNVITQPKDWGLYHQDDYNVVVDRLEIITVNKQYFKNFKGGLIFYNRTQKAINGSAYLIHNLTVSLAVHWRTMKFMSNEYRYFPANVDIGICDEFNKDHFNLKAHFKRYSNIMSCPPPPGYYYVKNLVPDFSGLPPFIPRGSYKCELKLYDNSVLLGEAHYYASVVDKPLKWVY